MRDGKEARRERGVVVVVAGIVVGGSEMNISTKMHTRRSPAHAMYSIKNDSLYTKQIKPRILQVNASVPYECGGRDEVRSYRTNCNTRMPLADAAVAASAEIEGVMMALWRFGVGKHC